VIDQFFEGIEIGLPRQQGMVRSRRKRLEMNKAIEINRNAFKQKETLFALMEAGK
jgi:hypothetical protein